MSDLPRTGQEWIADFASVLGVDAPSQETIDQLLDLAGVAAHSSERIAAPIACWLIGKAGLEPTAAIETARRV